VRISGDFDIPVGLKTRKVFSLAAKIISSQFYQTQRLVLCHRVYSMVTLAASGLEDFFSVVLGL
jgi:hypothetical protein